MFARTVAGLLLPQMPRNRFLRRHRKLQHVVYAHNSTVQIRAAYAVNTRCHTPTIANFPRRLCKFSKKENRRGSQRWEEVAFGGVWSYSHCVNPITTSQSSPGLALFLRTCVNNCSRWNHPLDYTWRNLIKFEKKIFTQPHKKQKKLARIWDPQIRIYFKPLNRIQNTF